MYAENSMRNIDLFICVYMIYIVRGNRYTYAYVFTLNIFSMTNPSGS